MDETLWFEEEIGPAESTVREKIEGLKTLDPAALAAALGDEALAALPKGEQRAARIEAFVRRELRGKIGVYQPLARRVTAGAALPDAAAAVGGAVAFAQGEAYLVRLGVEFDLSPRLQKAGYRYQKLWCRAELRAGEPPYPRLLDMAPDKLFRGGPRLVRVEAKPALTWGEAEASLGSIAGDVQIGVVMAATLAFRGPNEREPYWEITERDEAIRGQHHFWLLIDVPPGCDPANVRLGVLGEADVRGQLGRLALGPEVRAWQRRPSQTLAAMVGDETARRS